MDGIIVRFRQRGAWSNPYTYKPKEGITYKYGDIVIVPTDDFYSVAKVVKVQENCAFKGNTKYGTVINKLEVPSE